MPKKTNLFPYIDPLNKDHVSLLTKYSWLEEFKVSFDNHYGYVLDNGYLNAEKLDNALTFLETHYKRKPIVRAIQAAFDEFGATRFSESAPRTLDFAETSLFWVFETAAFVMVNKSIESNGKADDLYLVLKCFGAAHNLKDLWIDRYGRRKGADQRNKNYRAIEQDMYNAWLNFPASRKNSTQMSFNWLDRNHNPTNVGERTIKDWIRKWHKK